MWKVLQGRVWVCRTFWSLKISEPPCATARRSAVYTLEHGWLFWESVSKTGYNKWISYSWDLFFSQYVIILSYSFGSIYDRCTYQLCLKELDFEKKISNTANLWLPTFLRAEFLFLHQSVYFQSLRGYASIMYALPMSQMMLRELPNSHA